MDLNEVNDDFLLDNDPVSGEESIIDDTFIGMEGSLNDDDASYLQAGQDTELNQMLGVENDSEGGEYLKNDDPEDSQSGETGNEVMDNAVNQYLKSMGFDPNSIKVEDEDGEIKEYKFDELTPEEQLDLLTPEQEYSEDEISDMMFLRENNINLQELAQVIREKTIQELQQTPQQEYTVSDFTDEELFIIDYRQKYGEDFTDAELQAALDQAKENEGLFNKHTSKIRENFQAQEEYIINQEREQELAKQEEIENAYMDQVVQVAINENSLDNIVEMTDDDKRSILDFMFTKNAAGVTGFEKTVQNPEMRYKAAWYMMHGEQTINEMQHYYQNEIMKLERQVKSLTPKGNKGFKPESVVTKPSKHTNTRPRSIDELF